MCRYSLLLCLAQSQHLTDRPCARRRRSCVPAALEGAAAHKGLQVRHLAQRGRHAPGGQRNRLVQLLVNGLHLRARGNAVSPDACLACKQVPHDSLRMSWPLLLRLGRVVQLRCVGTRKWVCSKRMCKRLELHVLIFAPRPDQPLHHKAAGHACCARHGRWGAGEPRAP